MSRTRFGHRCAGSATLTKQSSITAQIADELRGEGIAPAIIYAFERTQSLLTVEGRAAGIYSQEQINEWDAAIAEFDSANSFVGVR